MTYDHEPRGTCVPGCELWGVCHCGCGQPATIAGPNDTRRYIVTGRPRVHLMYHAPQSRENWRRMAGNASNFHRHEIPLERVRPLVRFLVNRYGTMSAAAKVVGVSLTTVSAIVGNCRTEKSAVKPHVAQKFVDAVNAHRPAKRDPWATFDTIDPRPPTEWEKERAELYASEEYRRNRDLKKFSPGEVSAIDAKVKNRIARQHLRERRRQMAS